MGQALSGVDAGMCAYRRIGLVVSKTTGAGTDLWCRKMNAAPTDLTDKVAVVTGAIGGIGKAVCEHFRALGATVHSTDRSADEGCQAFDLLSDDGLARCVDWVFDCEPDILFNNAAIFEMDSALEADLAQYDKVFGVNVRAMYAVMRSGARSMVRRECKGSIINLASQAGHRGEALVAHYCASKAAVISYTQSAALALAERGVRVNALSPGVVDTPMWEHVDAEFARIENRPLGEKKRFSGQAVPLGRMGLPQDVARVAVFLASEQSAYLTAQTLSVDGGNVLR